MKLGLIKDIDNVFASYRQLESLSLEFCQFFPNANFEVVCVRLFRLRYNMTHSLPTDFEQLSFEENNQQEVTSTSSLYVFSGAR